jgi:hypothetical protein
MTCESEMGVIALDDFYNKDKKDIQFTDVIMDEFIRQVKSKFMVYGQEYASAQQIVEPVSSIETELIIPNRVLCYPTTGQRVLFLFISTPFRPAVLKDPGTQAQPTAVIGITPRDVAYTAGYARTCLEIFTGIRCFDDETVAETDQVINHLIEILDLGSKVKIDRFITNRGLSYRTAKIRDNEIIIRFDYFGVASVDLHVKQNVPGKDDFDFWLVNPNGRTYDGELLVSTFKCLEVYGTTTLIKDIIIENFDVEIEPAKEHAAAALEQVLDVALAISEEASTK